MLHNLMARQSHPLRRSEWEKKADKNKLVRQHYKMGKIGLDLHKSQVVAKYQQGWKLTVGLSSDVLASVTTHG